MFHNMVYKVVSDQKYKKMLHSIEPFCNYLELSEFSYRRITHGGQYCFMGSRIDWNEYFFDNFHPTDFPCIRPPDELHSGVSFMRITSDENYRHILDTAWHKFGLNMVISIQFKTSEAVESFGLCTKINHDRVEERLLRELPLIYRFIEYYRKENAKLIEHLHDHQVDLTPQFKSLNLQPKIPIPHSEKLDLLLRQYGWEAAESLTLREFDIISFLAHGYPANYIAHELHLSVRTVENYIATIKSKLSCDSKAALINKSKQIVDIRNLRN